MEVFIYPVSGVMKLWHLVLHDVFGVNDQVAWLVSLFGLIVTVRSIVLPLAWKQLRATRIMVNLRPQTKAIADSFAKRTDADADKEQREAIKALHKEHNFNASSGCFPALIQIPVFIGLYQVLLHMARPVEGIDAEVIHPIGFLNSDEVRSFLKVRIWDIPVPAYVSMSPEQLVQLNTNRDDVFWFVLPLVVVATIFTVGNMAYSIRRSYLTIDHENRVALRMNRFIIFMVLVIPFMLISAAVYSPVPAAIVVYWVANNLWTLAQIVVISVLLDRKMPLTDEFENFQDEAFVRRLEKETARKERKRSIRRHRLLMLVQPHKLLEHRREIIRIKKEYREQIRAEREKKREIRRLRMAAKKERRTQRSSKKESAETQAEQQPET
ncbi:membrane protein insertase YidC [Corynebacterium freiburgense]|uniref:membrane protein insertase YidC n=1 Tax=Corynebacterium freiburgense TaxID=556548 RepID=UPI00042714B3|nr:membrane protein insertase YidC [Corynebacterium freiburgense]WJZ03896.1 Membrane protein insertase MisCA precursor [Corynebacterium freiburgense]